MNATDFIPPGKFPVGTCSICGGPVCVHTNWCAVIPDVPACAKCGATKKNSHGPVIDMQPAGVSVFRYSTSTAWPEQPPMDIPSEKQ